MEKTVRHPSTRIATLLCLLLVGYAGNAGAQAPLPPTKVITFYNNSSKDTIFPCLRPTQGPLIYEFPGCPHALVDTPGYSTAIGDFCELEYNYLTNVPPKDIFNPYARLVHETLKTNAYAFSIDDKAAFLSV